MSPEALPSLGCPEFPHREQLMGASGAMSITETSVTRRSNHAATRRSAAAVAARAAGRTEARTLVFGLEIGGWSEIEAGNLVGLLLGIRPVTSGWRATEI